jgi:hypothetical protein
MHEPRRSGPTTAPPRETSDPWRPSAGYLALALAVAVIAPLAWLLWPAPGPATGEPVAAARPNAEPVPATSRPAAPSASAAPIIATPIRVASAAQMPAAPSPLLQDPDGDQTPDLADHLNPGETPTMAEVIARLQAAGVTSGLGAFQPPGTRPPLVGLAVPDDFVLPEGYVRHHQATDDGQRIEPILMYSPDHQWYDAAGRPVTLPPNRVVPQELAPPGLPIRKIVVPAGEPGK